MAAARILFLALLWAGVAIAADPSSRRTDELMRKSGIWTQMGELQGQVRSGIDEARSTRDRPGRPGIKDADLERVQAAGRVAFAPDRLRTWVSADLERLLTDADEAEVLTWLSSDLGARLTRIEEEGQKPANYAVMTRESPEFARTLPRERIERMRRLEKAVKAGEAATQITIGITTAVAYGVVTTSREADPDGIEEFRRQVEAQRPRMLGVLTHQMEQFFAWIYREVSDEDLDRYAEFAESRVGRKYHAATVTAMTNAIVRASLEMGERIGRAAGAQPRRGL